MTTAQIQAPRFIRLTGAMAPLPVDHIDTDQIIPASYLKTTSREGLAAGLFAGWRGDGADFVLDDPRYAEAPILVAGENFGCGSSREHAPWALLDHGIRAVVSTRFADIFRSNALKNGLLPVVATGGLVDRLMTTAIDDPTAEATVDLEQQILRTPWGEDIAFTVDPFARRCLLDGVDALGYLRARLPAIESFEARHALPWDTRDVAARVSGGLP
ncbi:MAG: 3-isopropylmalate dehydratase small subunit [Acidobacteriota bacterium]